MRKRHIKSPFVSWETIIFATAFIVLCCSVLCNNVACSNVQELENTHAEPKKPFAPKDDGGESRNRFSSTSFGKINNIKEDHLDLVSDEKEAKSVPQDIFSSPKTSSCNVFYIIISTIDGKVTALDLLKKGSLAWSIDADSQPLYSSSLAQMEIVRNGKKIRLIPSLDGAIYQFDGEKVEAIPMSADSLLSSTYRLNDDSMIVGSKDIRNYGVNLKTGLVHFTCSSDGCTNQEETENSDLDGNDVIIVTRKTQIIRSVDIKHGSEKWNFSVGEHQLSVPPPAVQSQIEDEGESKDGDSLPFFTTPKADCPNKKKTTDQVDYESLLQFLVPEGKIVALDKTRSRKVAWEHKFGSPIAQAWLLRNGKLEPMNLFDSKHVPTLTSFTSDDLENESSSQPLLYIGSHNKLLYIQPSPQMETILKTFPNHRIGHVFDPKVTISWKPYLSTAAARTPIFGGNRQHIMHGRKKDRQDRDGRSTSLSVWHEDYPFDTGYFLYPEFRESRSIKKGQILLEYASKQPDSFMNALPASIWHYWWQIAVMSVVISVFFHVIVKTLCPTPPATLVKESNGSMESCKNDKSNNHDLDFSPDEENPCDKSHGEYVSRFATDFDCLQCLGKGGFGIVFEAINKLDGQHYAVKRIMLPKSDGAKEKVLREVKALAQLEHPGIVRYFNSWEESPPAGWQKQWDTSQGLCDETTETMYTSTISQMTSAKEKNDPIRPFRSEPELETCTNTDSIVFLPDDDVKPSSQTDLRQSGSGEFSVHSELSESNSWSQDFAHQSQNDGHWSQWGLSSSLPGEDSLSGSKSSVPFSNYTSNSSKINVNSDIDLSGDSVVFEATSQNSSKVGLSKEYSKYSKGWSLSNLSGESDDEQIQSEPSQTSVSGNTFFVYIQTQLYQKETLKDWLTNNTLNRQRQVILEIFDQIVCAVDYVHSCDLMHRDLKPSNIFFSADGTVKIGDFGLATALSAQQEKDAMIEEKASSSERHTADVGTTLYMSPEQNARKSYNLKVDIFALGLIFLELWVPFPTQMERIRTLQDAKSRNQILPSRLIRELPSESELVKHMTSHNPSIRPSTKELLNHDLLKDVAFQRINLRNRTRTISDNSDP